MNNPTQQVSRETKTTKNNQFFMEAWIAAVKMIGFSFFHGPVNSPEEASHWRRLSPDLTLLRKSVANRCQQDAVFAAAVISFYNAEEGQKLLNKTGCHAFGSLASLLNEKQRLIVATLFNNYTGW